jgi:hypothetical protein
MLVRLVSLAVAFALGAAVPGFVVREDDATPHVRWLAIETPREAEVEELAAWRAAGRRHARGSYDEGRVDRVTWVPPQTGFPGARIIDGAFGHDAACEAERRDVRVLAFTTAGGPTATHALWNADVREVHVLRAAGDEALIILQGGNGRGDPGVELLAWDLARGAVEGLGAWRGPGVGWSMESSGVIRVHGGDRPAPFDRRATAERVGLTIVLD